MKDKILVVDSDPGIRSLLADVLPNFLVNTELYLADNGKDALARATNCCPFKLVVTGVAMPFIDGLRMTATLKRIYPTLPIIIISGSPEPSDHQADVFVSKPFDIDKLAEIIRQLLSKQAA